MLKAAVSGNQEKLARKYAALLAAQRKLSQWESEQGENL